MMMMGWVFTEDEKETSGKRTRFVPMPSLGFYSKRHDDGRAWMVSVCHESKDTLLLLLLKNTQSSVGSFSSSYFTVVILAVLFQGRVVVVDVLLL